MGRKRGRKGTKVEDVVWIDGYCFQFVEEVRGFRCSHFLYRSVEGGYLVSFTNVDVELGEVGAVRGRRRKGWMR